MERKFAGVPAGATMYIASPEIVDAYIRDIPDGTVSSLRQMRKDLAAGYRAEYCCPITSGIFLRIVAEAAYEACTAGKKLKDITPLWRIIDSKALITEKLSFGTEFIKEQRRNDGLGF